MGDSSTCLMQPLSYTSVLSPAEAFEGNPIHALGQSVSFGRFTSESLSWEKWSTFSHKQYVEEAERYSRPGSVAEKKAFFEAHYKKIAEKKKAEAALLEQANATAGDAPGSGDATDTSNSTLENMDLEKDLEPNKEGRTQIANPHSVSKMDKTKVHCEEDDVMELEKEQSKMHDVDKSPSEIFVPKSKDESFTTMKSETTELISLDKKQSAHKWPKPLNFTTVEELNLLSSKVKRKVDNSYIDGNCPEVSKDCSTPSKTPITVPNGTPASGDPQSEHQTLKNNTAAKRRAVTKRSSLAAECSKFLNACKNKLQSPKISTPFRLRTEERSARRRENLKDKFDAEDAQNVLLKTKLKELAETESRKWHPTLCFTVRTLPGDPKEMRRTKDLMKKVPTSRQPPKSGRKPENGTVQDAPLPSQTTSTKGKGIQEVSRKKLSDHIPIS